MQTLTITATFTREMQLKDGINVKEIIDVFDKEYKDDPAKFFTDSDEEFDDLNFDIKIKQGGIQDENYC